MARTSRKKEKAAKQPKTFIMKTALYVRLSNKDNGGKSEDGIENQLALLLDFIKQFECMENLSESMSELSVKKIESIEIYMDNGQTGTDFERQGWKRMMEDVKKGRINCIIVKDLSRFARNYLEAGEYLEEIFPFLGVRFIAINDHFDSAGEIYQKKEWMTELKNLANDYYSRDLSKKILSAFWTKEEQGQFIGSKAPYGYILKNNKYRIDPPAAEVVRRIFEMKMQGMSAYKIADIFNQEGIPSPSRYAGEQGIKKYKNCSHILWQQEAVSRILYNRAYIGDLVQGKYNYSVYSKERRGKRGEDTWKILEGTHPAIIDRAVFQKVQEMKEKNRKIWKDRQGGLGYENVLKGILVCGICHHAMRRNKDIRNGKVKYYFFCSSAYSQIKCSTSSIADYKILDMVLKQIKLQIDFAVKSGEFLEQLKKSDSSFAVYRQKRKKMEQIREENRWLKVFLDFKDAKELTREMAVSLLEKIEVYEEKRIHIKFRFRKDENSGRAVFGQIS